MGYPGFAPGSQDLRALSVCIRAIRSSRRPSVSEPGVTSDTSPHAKPHPTVNVNKKGRAAATGEWGGGRRLRSHQGTHCDMYTSQAGSTMLAVIVASFVNSRKWIVILLRSEKND